MNVHVRNLIIVFLLMCATNIRAQIHSHHESLPSWDEIMAEEAIQTQVVLDYHFLNIELKEAIFRRLRDAHPEFASMHEFYFKHYYLITDGMYYELAGKPSVTPAELKETVDRLAESMIGHFKNSGYTQSANTNAVTPIDPIKLSQDKFRRTPQGPGDDCNNPDFETCDFTGWETYIGEVNPNPYQMVNITSTNVWCSEVTNQCTNMPPPDPTCGCDLGNGQTQCGNGCTGSSTINGVCTCTSCPCATNSHHYIVNGGIDEVSNVIPKVFPGGGGCTALIGDKTGTGGKAASIVQTFRVSKANANFIYHWAAVLQDPGTSHTAGEKPFIKINFYDSNGNPIPCGNYEAYPGDGKDGWVAGGAFSQFVYKNWTTVFVPLDAFIGQDVTFEFIVGDCSQGGHYGYGYVDLSCNSFDILVGSEVPCGETTLCAPAGAASYQWSTGETTECINPPVTDDYYVTVTPYTGVSCSAVLDTSVVIGPKSVTADFTATSGCIGDVINFTDNSTASGTTLDTWSWDFDNNGTIDDTNQNQPTSTIPPAPIP